MFTIRDMFCPPWFSVKFAYKATKYFDSWSSWPPFRDNFKIGGIRGDFRLNIFFGVFCTTETCFGKECNEGKSIFDDNEYRQVIEKSDLMIETIKELELSNKKLFLN